MVGGGRSSRAHPAAVSRAPQYKSLRFAPLTLAASALLCAWAPPSASSTRSCSVRLEGARRARQAEVERAAFGRLDADRLAHARKAEAALVHLERLRWLWRRVAAATSTATASAILAT